MKYVIVENESLAREQLKSMVESIRPGWELVHISSTVEETVRFFSNGGDADLCFFDIELNDDNCFEIFSRAEVPAPVIFTTAYHEFMLEAFKVHSIDYLLKPLLKTDIEAAIQKFEKYHLPLQAKRVVSKISREDLYASLSELLQEGGQPKLPKRVLTMSGDTYGFINIEDVAWFVSEDKYIFAVDHAGRKRMSSLQTLADALDTFGDKRFFRIQRNILCSIGAVKSVSKFFKGRLSVCLEAGSEKHRVTVSAERRGAFLTWLGS